MPERMSDIEKSIILTRDKIKDKAPDAADMKNARESYKAIIPEEKMDYNQLREKLFSQFDLLTEIPEDYYKEYQKTHHKESWRREENLSNRQKKEIQTKLKEFPEWQGINTGYIFELAHYFREFPLNDANGKMAEFYDKETAEGTTKALRLVNRKNSFEAIILEFYPTLKEGKKVLEAEIHQFNHDKIGDSDYSYNLEPVEELLGKTLGIDNLRLGYKKDRIGGMTIGGSPAFVPKMRVKSTIESNEDLVKILNAHKIFPEITQALDNSASLRINKIRNLWLRHSTDFTNEGELDNYIQFEDLIEKTLVEKAKEYLIANKSNHNIRKNTLGLNAELNSKYFTPILRYLENTAGHQWSSEFERWVKTVNGFDVLKEQKFTQIPLPNELSDLIIKSLYLKTDQESIKIPLEKPIEIRLQYLFRLPHPQEDPNSWDTGDFEIDFKKWLKDYFGEDEFQQSRRSKAEVYFDINLDSCLKEFEINKNEFEDMSITDKKKIIRKSWTEVVKAYHADPSYLHRKPSELKEADKEMVKINRIKSFFDDYIHELQSKDDEIPLGHSKAI